MFGMMEALLSFVRRQVGLRTDAADAAGSLHAKIKNLIDNVIPTLQKPRIVVVFGRLYVDSNTTYQTALNISGKGKLNAIRVASTYETMKFQITIDGTVIAKGKSATSADSFPLPNFLFTNDDSVRSMDTVAEGGSQSNLGGGLSFASTLKIEFASATSSSYGTIYWSYEKEA